MIGTMQSCINNYRITRYLDKIKGVHKRKNCFVVNGSQETVLVY